MKGLLVRVAADQSDGGGNWNAPVDTSSCRFAYVPIPESKPNRPSFETPYSLFGPAIAEFGCSLPAHLMHQRMHLDPDFEYLTYGDRGSKGRQISGNLGQDDLLVFYSGLRDAHSRALVYAIIGIFCIDRILHARTQPRSDWHRNAHTRRELAQDADDVIVFAKEAVSGRLVKCIEIGEFRRRAYRVKKPLLDAWGGISARDGFLQRSAVFPSLLEPRKFMDWLLTQDVALVAENNPIRS